MRYSKASVQMFDLGVLVANVADGKLGIPEFQRDFDWSESDIRSLLATVFSGWPAGSLLLLDGHGVFFTLREFEKGPRLSSKVKYAVLDGQQRLTSLYQALYDAGDRIFAVKWDVPADQDLEDSIVSYRRDVWGKQYSNVEQQLQHRVIPVSTLKSPTEFFMWRDELLDRVQSPEKSKQLKRALTDLYSTRLNAIHDYEFPVVLLDETIEPFAIARIFEKVNKTGMTLGSFDLMVAKTFDPGWNLRDKWTAAKEDFPILASFFQDDGMPLLQAIALLERTDVRQSAVLALSKHRVQQNWNEVVHAAARTIEFLRFKCGVARRDFMPYANLVAPLIALETGERVGRDPGFFEQWFWYASFAGAYDVAANTRLVSHYKNILEANGKGYLIPERRYVRLGTATRKTDKALWAATNCALIKSMERSQRLDAALVEELDVSTLYSIEEITSVPRQQPVLTEELDLEFRGAINSLLVPKRLAAVIQKASSVTSLRLCRESELADFTLTQLPTDLLSSPVGWAEFRALRSEWLINFMRERGVKNVCVVGAARAPFDTIEVEL